MRHASDSFKLVPIARLTVCLAILSLSLVLTGAATPVSAFAPALPLSEMLNPDGTLNLTTGFHGSLDARGWQLISGPHEPPRFAPQTAPLALPGNQDWASNFTYRGVSYPVLGLAVDGSNNVYAGGVFNVAGSVPANYVAKWNANGWSALGSGTNYFVFSVATGANGHVYAGGLFNWASDLQLPKNLSDAFPDLHAPAASANFIAEWNGTTWSSVGSGMNGPVLALAVDGSGNLYAGGAFLTPGSATAKGIAKWNGSTWSAMGNGFNNVVNALAVDSSNNVYAGGDFILACDATCAPATSTLVNHIAKWNGSSWSAVGNGFPSTVRALALDSSNNLYAGGDFDTLCGVGPGCPLGATVNHVAKWSAGAWSAMANGFDTTVRALLVDGSNNVYAGGDFTIACGVGLGCPPGTTVNRIAKWNAGAWTALSGGVNSVVFALAHDSSNNVYAGGAFITAGSIYASFIAKWNGSAWSDMGTGDGVNAAVLASAHDSSSNLYVGGAFNVAGSTITNGIAKWNGSAWSAVGNGLNNAINALAVDSSNNVYVGGAFHSVCGPGLGCPAGATANHIAKWNGSAWSALANGLNDTVYALAVDSNNNVYAGGTFWMICGAGPGCPAGATAFRIAKWSGGAWSAVGSGFTDDVNTLAVDSHNYVYAGGKFGNLCGIGPGCPVGAVVNHISKWNGVNWQPVGTGLNDTVMALMADRSDNIYAGGAFTLSGNSLLFLKHVGQWDGSSWRALANGFDGNVLGLEVDSSNNIYAAGDFVFACDATCNEATSTAVNHVAVWTGSGWSPLGSGTNGVVKPLTAVNKMLYVGGMFSMAGGKVSLNFGSVVIGQLYLPFTVR